jgi:putative endonuclease
VIARLLARFRPAGTDAKSVGARGERAAAAHLRAAGYKVLHRNLRVGVGEADLVCRSPDRCTLVIVEVKARELGEGGELNFPPEANITAHKRRQLLRVAHAAAIRLGWRDKPLRIDVVGVELRPGVPPTIRHHVSAVEQ